MEKEVRQGELPDVVPGGEVQLMFAGLNQDRTLVVPCQLLVADAFLYKPQSQQYAPEALQTSLRHLPSPARRYPPDALLHA